MPRARTFYETEFDVRLEKLEGRPARCWPSACYCGRTGCIETYLSGPGLAADYAEASGRAQAAEQIVAQADAGDVEAAAAMARYERRMARALASIINVLDPDVIVLGGGLSKVRRLYDNVPGLWAPYVFSDHVATRIVQAKFGDASGVRGAAWLWEPGEAARRR